MNSTQAWLQLATAFLLLAAMVIVTQAVAAVAPVPGADKAKVLVQEVKPTDDTRRLLVPVKVEAQVSSLVVAEAEGLVTRIKKPLGASVKRGEVVLTIENKDPAFTYAAVPVRAPIAGVISQLHPSLMSRVSRGDKLFTVIDPAALKLTAEIPGSELSLIHPGSKGQFKRDLAEAEGLAIEVSGISPLVDPRTGTASAELTFANAKGAAAALPAIGSVGHAFFEITRGKVLLIPESALGYSEGKPVVKVLDAGGSVKRKPIELGEQKESQLVVKSGLAAGEKLIVRANRTLKDGEAVDVEQPETAKN